MASFNPNPNPGAPAGAPADANGDLCTTFTGLGLAPETSKFSDKLAWLDPLLYTRLHTRYLVALEQNATAKAYADYVVADQGKRIRELTDKNNKLKEALAKALSRAPKMPSVTAGNKAMKKGGKAKGNNRVTFKVP